MDRTCWQAVAYRDYDYPVLRAGAAAGGAWQPSPATFAVRELPAYAFCGEGEHAALVVRKQGLTTREVAQAVARKLQLAPAAVGYAGMKDKAATTVQAFTVAGVAEQRAAEAFAGAGCEVLECSRHRNKLRLGHLAGNRFAALLRDVDAARAEAVLQQLAQHGVPNYYGPQRFGARGDNARGGLRVLRGELRAKRWKRDLLLSALQSLLFNEVLARRLEAGQLAQALAGDVLRREDSGGLFLCEEPQQEQPRLERFEISATGPMPGRKMVAPTAVAAAQEAAVLDAFGLEAGLFAPCRGSRRPLRVPLGEPALEPAPESAAEEGVWLHFTLPAGAFATSVLREIIGPAATGTATTSTGTGGADAV